MTWTQMGSNFKIRVTGAPSCSGTCALPHPSVGGGALTQDCTDSLANTITVGVPVNWDDEEGLGLVLGTLPVLISSNVGTTLTFRVESLTINRTITISVQS